MLMVALFHNKNGSPMQNLGFDIKIWGSGLGWGNSYQLIIFGTGLPGLRLRWDIVKYMHF